MLDDGTVVGEQVLEDDFPIEMDKQDAAKILEARFQQMSLEEIARQANLPPGTELQLRRDQIEVADDLLDQREVVEWTQPPDWTSNYDTASRKIAPGTVAFQAHDPNSFTYYKNIRIKPLN
jgi:hypothetical protein